MTRPPLRFAGIWTLGVALTLAGCGGMPSLPGSGGDSRAAVAVESENGESGDGELRLGVLAPRELASGQCGLFLWSRTPMPELVFFSNPETGRAAIALDGDEVTLTRLAVDGPTAGGRGAQTFATDSGDVSVRLAVLETETVQDGYRVTSASLRVTTDDGWSGVVAAAGLAACRA